MASLNPQIMLIDAVEVTICLMPTGHGRAMSVVTAKMGSSELSEAVLFEPEENERIDIRRA